MQGRSDVGSVDLPWPVGLFSLLAEPLFESWGRGMIWWHKARQSLL